jgi:hypothetical protein
MYKHEPKKIAAMFAIPKIPEPPKHRKTHAKVSKVVLNKRLPARLFDKLLSSIAKQYTKEVPQIIAVLLSRIDAIFFIKKKKQG